MSQYSGNQVNYDKIIGMLHMEMSAIKKEDTMFNMKRKELLGVYENLPWIWYYIFGSNNKKLDVFLDKW